MKRIEERRPAVRVAVDLDARYSFPTTAGIDVPTHPARVTEISASGLRLLSVAPLRDGQLVTVSFTVNGRAPGSRNDLCVVARVVRTLRADPGAFEYALRLVDNEFAINAMRRAVLMVSLGSA